MAEADPIPTNGQPPFAWPADTEHDLVRFLEEWDPVIAAALNNFRFPPDDEHDLAQQVRFAVIQKFRSGAVFPTTAQFAAFLRRTTRGLCLNRIRKSRRVAGLPADPPDPTSADDFTEEFPPGLPPGERVRWLVENAREDDRRLLHLRIIEGLTFAEIGVRLGISTTTAHDRYVAAERRLNPRSADDTD